VFYRLFGKKEQCKNKMLAKRVVEKDNQGRGEVAGLLWLPPNVSFTLQDIK